MKGGNSELGWSEGDAGDIAGGEVVGDLLAEEPGWLGRRIPKGRRHACAEDFEGHCRAGERNEEQPVPKRASSPASPSISTRRMRASKFGSSPAITSSISRHNSQSLRV